MRVPRALPGGRLGTQNANVILSRALKIRALIRHCLEQAERRSPQPSSVSPMYLDARALHEQGHTGPGASPMVVNCNVGSLVRTQKLRHRPPRVLETLDVPVIRRVARALRAPQQGVAVSALSASESCAGRVAPGGPRSLTPL